MTKSPLDRILDYLDGVYKLDCIELMATLVHDHLIGLVLLSVELV